MSTFDCLSWRTPRPPPSLLQSPALAREFVTRRARAVACLPEVHRRPLLAGAEGRNPEPLVTPAPGPRPALAHVFRFSVFRVAAPF